MKAAQRKALPARAFAYPKQRLYPIDTVGRARNALARSAQSGTRGSYSTVAKAVRARYGERIASVGRSRGTISAPGYRAARRK